MGQRVLDSMWEAVRRGQEDPILPSARGHEIRELLDAPLPREGIAVDEVPRRVVEIVYADVDPVLWGAAELSVRAQLAYLAERR